MHTDDLRPLLDRVMGECDRAAEPFVDRRFLGKRSNHPLSAGADQQRLAQRMEHRDIVHQGEIVGQGLTKAEARIDDDLFALETRRDDIGDPLFEPIERIRHFHADFCHWMARA